jgi:uncharacterized membrane-anchored protein YitT (DUF2179 family)
MKRRLPFDLRREAASVALLLSGVTILAFSFALFQVPHSIAAGGMSGLSLIVNHFTGLPIGAIYFALNVPMFVLGFFNLGRWRFLGKALLGVFVFSALTDILLRWLPQMMATYPVTDNVLLSAIFGGIVSGLGTGFVYRSGASAGGTSILSRVVQLRTGNPLSQVFLMIDGTIVAAMGLVFGWETALYALLMLFLWGMASDYVLEGPSSVRTVTIVTERPEPILAGLREELGRTASHWEITGGYSGERRHMILCTVHRSQVIEVRQLVAAADPAVFFVIGDAHQAVGGGFGRKKQ